MVLLAIPLMMSVLFNDNGLFDLMCNQESSGRLQAYTYLEYKLINNPCLDSIRSHLRYRIKEILENRVLIEVNTSIYWIANKDSNVFMLVKLLEMDNSSDSLKLLVRCLSLNVEQSPINSERAWSIDYRYPVAGMLVKKGERVVPVLIDSLASTIEDGRHRRNCCWVLQKILGNEKCLDVIDETLPKLDKYRSRSLEQCREYFKSDRILPNPSGPASRYYNIN